MRGHYKILNPPTLLPVTLDYVKEHSKVDYTDEDTVLTGYLWAAVQEAEKYCNRAIMEQTIFQTLNAFPAVNNCNAYAEIRLFASPAKELLKIQYWNTEDTPVLTTLFLSTGTAEEQAAALLHTVNEPGSISPKVGTTWPSVANRPAAVEITYKCGYANADAVPHLLKQAIVLLTASHYERREDYVKRYKTAAEHLMDLVAVQGW